MAKTATERQADWRRKVKTYQEWKAHILARWREHNVFRYIKQEDGGIKIQLESTDEGDRITAELAELCGMDPETVIQKMVGECLAEMGGKFVPASKEQQELTRLRAETAALRDKLTVYNERLADEEADKEAIREVTKTL